jgi:hypothetical protein
MDWECVFLEGKYILSGEWDLAEVNRTLAYFKKVPESAEIILELTDVEIQKGTAMALLITVIRFLLAKHNRLVLLRSPQMLAHTLYKTNMLRQCNIVLIEPREDSGIGI